MYRKEILITNAWSDAGQRGIIALLLTCTFSLAFTFSFTFTFSFRFTCTCSFMFTFALTCSLTCTFAFPLSFTCSFTFRLRCRFVYVFVNVYMFVFAPKRFPPRNIMLVYMPPIMHQYKSAWFNPWCRPCPASWGA
jgi:hypothetical protein